MHRVHNLGTVEGDVGEVIFLSVLDELQIHRKSP
jgi:hypothetical protein